MLCWLARRIRWRGKAASSPFSNISAKVNGAEAISDFFYLRDFLTHVTRRPIEISKLQWSIFVFLLKNGSKGKRRRNQNEGETFNHFSPFSQLLVSQMISIHYYLPP